MNGKVLGRTQVQTLARYADLARDSVKASASRIADSIGTDILTNDVAANSLRLDDGPLRSALYGVELITIPEPCHGSLLCQLPLRVKRRHGR